MFQCKDQSGRTVVLKKFPPKRIISLVPSQTELLFDLGLHEEVIGITKFCVHPEEWFRNKTRIGGTKTVKLEKIAPVWISDIQDIPGAFDMIQSIGMITGKEMQATALINQIKKDFSTL